MLDLAYAIHRRHSEAHRAIGSGLVLASRPRTNAFGDGRLPRPRGEPCTILMLDRRITEGVIEFLERRLVECGAKKVIPGAVTLEKACAGASFADGWRVT